VTHLRCGGIIVIVLLQIFSLLDSEKSLKIGQYLKKLKLVRHTQNVPNFWPPCDIIPRGVCSKCDGECDWII